MLGQQEPTNLQNKWQHWDEGPGVLRQQCKCTDAVHAQRVETSRWYQLYTANDDLRQRIDQRLHDLTGVDCAENPTPEIQAVDILPVINRLEVLLLLYRHRTAQVNGKLTDIDEGMLVRGMRVQGIHLCQCALHEVDHGQDIGRGEPGILHKCDVHLLEQGT